MCCSDSPGSGVDERLERALVAAERMSAPPSLAAMMPLLTRWSVHMGRGPSGGGALPRVDCSGERVERPAERPSEKRLAGWRRGESRAAG
eukprot:scaffold84411_cov31-Tisochrysis_lutea.AAC.1